MAAKVQQKNETAKRQPHFSSSEDDVIKKGSYEIRSGDKIWT